MRLKSAAGAGGSVLLLGMVEYMVEQPSGFLALGQGLPWSIWNAILIHSRDAHLPRASLPGGVFSSEQKERETSRQARYCFQSSLG